MSQLPAVLAELRALAVEPGERIALGEILDRLGAQGFPLALIGLGLVALVPGPPLFPLLVGIPVLVLGAQMLGGRTRPSLPGFARRVDLPRARLRQALDRLPAWLTSGQGTARPGGQRPAGAVVLLLGGITCLPFPFGTVLPAFAVLATAGGLLRGDRRLLLLGYSLAAAAVTVTATVIVGLTAALRWAVA